MSSWHALPGFFDLIDILLVTGVVWLGIGVLRRTRARSALVGLALISLIYVVARGLELRLMAALLQGFFAVSVLILVVVFQEDLRRLFDGLGSWRPGREAAPGHDYDILVRALSNLASRRIGALVVIPGREALDRHLTGGIALHGRISEPLLLSIFDASSPGHDGAVLLVGGIIERFAVHLPLSSNHDAIGSAGTRHAAALGLAERSDATVIAVSEERGTVSVARNGELRVLGRPEDLLGALRAVSQEEVEEEAPLLHRRSVRDGGVAFVAAIALWMLMVPGSEVIERTVNAPIFASNLPPDLAIETIAPPTVEIILRGQRRDLMLAERNPISVRLDAYLARMGRRTFTITPDAVDRPASLTVVAITPDKVRLSLMDSALQGSAEADPAGESPEANPDRRN